MRAHVARIDGLTWTERPLSVYEPEGHVRTAVAQHLSNGNACAQHQSIEHGVTPTRQWPIRGCVGGRLVQWEPDRLYPYCTQREVCTRILVAKCHGTTPGISGFWAPSFVLDGTQAYLIDGHHALTLIHLSRTLGLHTGPVPAFAHLRGGQHPLARPRLDCDCPATTAASGQRPT